jgi:hypothetical protein
MRLAFEILTGGRGTLAAWHGGGVAVRAGRTPALPGLLLA